MTLKETIEKVLGREIYPDTVAMYAKDQWGAITAFIRSEDKARIKELEEKNIERKQLNDILSTENTWLVNEKIKLEAQNKELLEILRSVYNCSGQRNCLTQPVLDEVLRAITK